MYASFTMFTLGPGTRPAAEKLGEQFAPVLRSMKGFKNVTFIGDDSTGEYAALVLWESKDDAEAAVAATGPELEKALSGMMKGPPKRGVYEVWEI
jgi:heme-degrading monooxygenase HmoA